MVESFKSEGLKYKIVNKFQMIYVYMIRIIICTLFITVSFINNHFFFCFVFFTNNKGSGPKGWNSYGLGSNSHAHFNGRLVCSNGAHCQKSHHCPQVHQIHLHQCQTNHDQILMLILDHCYHPVALQRMRLWK